LKFKTICFIFNIIIILFLLTICLLPYFILGTSFALRFWQSLWPLAAVLVMALLGMDIFFLNNHKLFRLLEREDWPALADYLESRVVHKGHYSPRLVRLLANTYLVMSDSPAVTALENKIALVKPRLLDANVLVFGAARILGGDTSGAVNFFSGRIESAKAADRVWVRWYYGFSLLLNRQYDEAAAEFKPLARESPDAMVAGLSAYFLSGTLKKNSSGGADCEDAARAGKDRIKATLKNRRLWAKETAKITGEVHAAILQQYIDKAEAWLFGVT
jgi:hypothetical protein